MPIDLRDITTCAVGLVFPYAMFLGFRPPFDLRLDTSSAGKFEKLSYHWLKPVLVLAGAFGAGAGYADRHTDDGFTFGLLLATAFAIWTLSIPAGALAFRQNCGWKKKSAKDAR